MRWKRSRSYIFRYINVIETDKEKKGVEHDSKDRPSMKGQIKGETC